MKEKLISSETARLAKEKGFILHQGHMKMYRDEDGYLFSNIGPAYDILNHCSHAPTQSFLQKWLREKHNISIIILHLEKWTDDDNNTYCVFDYDLKDISNGVKHISKSSMTFKTYEEALEKGLQKALKLIKN